MHLEIFYKVGVSEGFGTGVVVQSGVVAWRLMHPGCGLLEWRMLLISGWVPNLPIDSAEGGGLEAGK